MSNTVMKDDYIPGLPNLAYECDFQSVKVMFVTILCFCTSVMQGVRGH